MHARTRPDIDDPVGFHHRFLVMLDDDQRVAQIAHILQRLDQSRVITLMQPDRRLVQHVQYAGQLRADLRGQPDPLRLAAGQCARQPVQRQIFQTHVL